MTIKPKVKDDRMYKLNYDELLDEVFKFIHKPKKVHIMIEDDDDNLYSYE